MEAGLASPRIHDLEELLDRNLPHEPLWAAFRQNVIDLTSYAVNYRYPGNSATPAMAQTAMLNCQTVRAATGLSRNLIGFMQGITITA